jgi:outer membrane protein insertion porin family
MELIQDRFTMTYDDWNATISANIARRWTPNYAILTLTGGISSTLQNNVYNENINVPVDTGISLYANRWGISNSVYGQFSVDNRDLSYDPSKGWFMSQRFSWHGLVPYYEKEFFLKSDTKLEGYFKLFDLPVTEKWSFKMVFAAYTGITSIIPCSEVSDGNKAYIDGMINGRGWTEVYKETKGMFMLSNRLELRMPIVPGIVGIDGFWDAIAVKPKLHDLSSLSMNDFYFSFGPGIRFLLPQLPLHLVFAWRYRVIEGVPKFAYNPFQFVLSFNIVNN